MPFFVLQADEVGVFLRCIPRAGGTRDVEARRAVFEVIPCRSGWRPRRHGLMYRSTGRGRDGRLCGV